MITVTVDDRPLDVAAIVERGRVLLPMRATFTALGASVQYHPSGHVIVARSADHTLRLQLGSNAATVDGQRVRLDVPARVVANRTYVPLRFVATAMGSVVGYDARAKLVNVVAPHAHIARRSTGVNVVALTPVPESNTASAYPTISASLGAASASRANVTLTVDGQDVTALASFDGKTITYMPRIGLARGTHNVLFAGRTAGGDPFSASWSFDTSLQAPPDAPAINAYDYRFYVSGRSFFYPGDWMHFVLVAPPGGSAELQLCGMGYQYPLWSSGTDTIYEANFPAPNGYWMPECAVTATYTAWNGQQYFVPIPVMIGLYTSPNPFPTPTPKPTFSPRPIPSGPRRAEPTPTPTPTPTAKPTPAPTPRRSSGPIPRRTPSPPPRPLVTPEPVVKVTGPVPRRTPHPRDTP